jgi:Uma2 family endonuclease
VEVRSPGNSLEELAEKKAAYFRAGAREVWMCDQNSMLTDSASEFLPELADFYAFPAEIRNCPGVTPMIRLK